MKKNLFIIFIIMLLPLLCCSEVFAIAKEALPNYHDEDYHVPGHMIVSMCDGPVYYCPSGERNWRKITNGQSVMHGDSIRTLDNAYMALSWDADNMILVKPNSAFKVLITPEAMNYSLCLQLFKAEIMVSSRNSAQIHTESRFGKSLVTHGDTSIITNDNMAIIRAAKGQTEFTQALDGTKTTIPEGYVLEMEPTGAAKPMYQFDIVTEYENYHRFENWIKRFEEQHIKNNAILAYRIDSVKVNGEFISNMQNDKGLFVIETDNKRVPKSILFQFKITPIPPLDQRFEISIGKDLVYAVREGRDGYYEVNFALPSIPEFFVTINQIDSINRRMRIFNAGFSVLNKRFSELKAREFCKELSEAVTKRDQMWFRKNVSKDFRDFQGNTWTDFSLVTQTIMRNYRDIRLMIHPFRFEFRKGETLVHVNYRLTALTANWKYRYDDKGSDIYTLKAEEGVWKLKSKVSGMFFNRMKTTIDLRKAVLRGRVVDERTGYPIEGVKVTLVGTKYTATTDSMGEYIIYSVEPGRYNIKFTKNGYSNITATSVTLNPAGEYNVQR